MPNSWFQFKQFRINQAHNAMKITTDACVFGALADFSHCKQILDIGAGTGLLSLMVAQRFPQAHITGIEIDEASWSEMQQNFMDSPWQNRLTGLCMDVMDYAINPENKGKFDGIVSNPPFFQSSLQSGNSNLNRVRHSDGSLTVSDLLRCVVQLMAPNGRFFCLYPFDRKEEVLSKALEFGLYLHKILVLQNTASHPPHRVILEFGFTKQKPDSSIFFIRNPDNSVYAEDVIELMKPFYL